MATEIRLFNDDSSGGSNGRQKQPEDAIEMVPTRSPPQIPVTLILTEANAVEETGYMFSTRRKWWILTVVALCQTSMSKWFFVPPTISDFRGIKRQQTTMRPSTLALSSLSMSTTTSAITTSPTREPVWLGF